MSMISLRSFLWALTFLETKFIAFTKKAPLRGMTFKLFQITHEGFCKRYTKKGHTQPVLCNSWETWGVKVKCLKGMRRNGSTLTKRPLTTETSKMNSRMLGLKKSLLNRERRPDHVLPPSQHAIIMRIVRVMLMCMCMAWWWTPMPTRWACFTWLWYG